MKYKVCFSILWKKALFSLLVAFVIYSLAIKVNWSNVLKDNIVMLMLVSCPCYPSEINHGWVPWGQQPYITITSVCETESRVLYVKHNFRHWLLSIQWSATGKFVEYSIIDLTCLLKSHWFLYDNSDIRISQLCYRLIAANLMAVFSVASGSSAAGRSSARISSGLRGSFRGTFCSLPLIPIPAVMAFHKALWDLEPAEEREIAA